MAERSAHPGPEQGLEPIEAQYRARAVTVSPAAYAQSEAIRDQWLAPLVAQITEQAERIGRLEAERVVVEQLATDATRRAEAAEREREELRHLAQALQERHDALRSVAVPSAPPSAPAGTYEAEVTDGREPPAALAAPLAGAHGAGRLVIVSGSRTKNRATPSSKLDGAACAAWWSTAASCAKRAGTGAAPPASPAGRSCSRSRLNHPGISCASGWLRSWCERARLSPVATAIWRRVAPSASYPRGTPRAPTAVGARGVRCCRTVSRSAGVVYRTPVPFM